MDKQLTIICIIGMLLAVGFSGCFEEKPEISNTIKLQVLVVSTYLNNEYYWEWNNETYTIDVNEGEYFGVPNTSLLVTNKSLCNVSDGSQLFRFIEKIDETHVKIQFNESALYNYTTQVIGYNPAADPSWILENIYIDNPIIISTNITLFFPKVGSLGNVWQIDPNPYVRLYLSIVRIEEKYDLKCEPTVVVSGINYSSNPDDVPYNDAHNRFSENYTDSDLSIKLRNTIIQNMTEKAEQLGENSSILYEAIKVTYDNWEESPNMIPCYAEKALYNNESVWIIALNRCLGDCSHFDIFYVSIQTLETQWYTGCNSTSVIYWFGCD